MAGRWGTERAAYQWCCGDKGHAVIQPIHRLWVNKLHLKSLRIHYESWRILSEKRRGTLMQWESLYRLVERSAGNQHRLQMSRNLQFRNNPLYCFIEIEKCVHFITNTIKNLPRRVIKFILTCQKYVKNSHDILSTRENPRLQPYGHSCKIFIFWHAILLQYVGLVQP